MANVPAIPAVPPTNAIVDPQARSAIEALTTMMSIRNGQTGANDRQAFVTRADFNNLTQSALSNIFNISLGTPASINTPTGNNGGGIIVQPIAPTLLSLAKAIAATPLFNNLGAQITLIRSAAKAYTDAGITTEQTIRISKDNALAAAINTVWANIGGNSALIQDGQLASVTPVAASATKWTQVQAAVTDPNTGLVAAAAIRSTYNAYVNNVNGTMNASYILQAQLSSGGQTIVGGFGLMATAGAGSSQGPTIDFGVRADKFFIAGTSSTPSLATQLTNINVPFIVVTTIQTLGGITYYPGVYMQTAFIVDASISTAKIQDAAITNAKIGSAAVDTFSIAGNAVTVPQYLTSYSLTTAINDTAVEHSVMTMTVDFGPVAPAAVLLHAICQAVPNGTGTNSTLVARIYVDNVQQVSYSYSLPGSFGGALPLSGGATTTSGVHTVELRVLRQDGSTNYTIPTATISVLGAKR